MCRLNPFRKMEDKQMRERIRRIVSKEYDNTLGIVAYKNNQKVLDFFLDYKLKRNQEQLKDLTIEHFLMCRMWQYMTKSLRQSFTVPEM